MNGKGNEKRNDQFAITPNQNKSQRKQAEINVVSKRCIKSSITW